MRNHPPEERPFDHASFVRMIGWLNIRRLCREFVIARELAKNPKPKRKRTTRKGTKR